MPKDKKENKETPGRVPSGPSATSRRKNAGRASQRAALNILALRQMRDPQLSQLELAQKSGVGFTTVRDVERDLRQNGPGVNILEKIAHALGVGVGELLK